MNDALTLFGIALLDGGEHGALAPETTTIAVRDLAAVVEPSSYQRIVPEERDLERHTAVLEGIAARHAVAPAPVGTVFRDRAALVRWLELHYHALHEALAFLDGRTVARVHVVRRDEDGPHDAGLAPAAAEIVKNLRAQSAAMVPLKTEHLTGIVLSGAFLVERDKWNAFTAAVGLAARDNDDLDVRLTGPWPPYDFVRLDLGG